MATDKKLNQLVQNILTKEQYNSASKNPDEQYFITDDDYFATKNDLAGKQNTISDLTIIRSNASTGAGLAPQVAVNTQRIEDLTTAKFPNVVIVGTPHIEGGQVSNYSDTSYLQFPFVDISRGLPFDIYFSFTTAQDVTTQQNILDAYFGIALAVQNGKGIMALSSNGTSWDIGTSTGTNTLLPNTTYYVKYSWTGTEYSAALSTDDQTYVPDMNLASTLSPHKTTIFIGGSPNIFGAGSAHPFKGTINFNKSKVVVNGITVWEGMADVGLASRANVSLNNLDEVGEERFTAKADDSNTVHKTGNEEISGSKTFTSNIRVSQTAGGSGQGIAIYDGSNGNSRLEQFRTGIGASTEVYYSRITHNNSNGKSGAYIEIRSDSVSKNAVFSINNISSTSIPTPTEDTTTSMQADTVGARNKKIDSIRTNCITEIPQDIKLELNNGTLTLKAGSKVYVPNGSGVFDVVNISTDLLRNPSTADGKYLLFYNKNGFLNGQLLLNCSSGNSVGSFSGYFYDTSNNKINWYVNGVNQGQGDMSLPLCIYNCSSNSITSIDQVFNGFGYIGSTVFALPNVKGLIPNGRNADGSLRNIEISFSKVTTQTNNSAYSGDVAITSDYFDLAKGNIYNEVDNRNYLSDGVTPYNRCIAGKFVKGTNGIVTSLQPKTPFHAVDYNDKETISGWGMPSNRYIDLTLGASGSEYTAPANGWFAFARTAGTTNRYNSLKNNTSKLQVDSVMFDTGLWGRCYIPCKKGDVVGVEYNSTGQTKFFRFIYAEGEN